MGGTSNKLGFLDKIKTGEPLKIHTEWKNFGNRFQESILRY